MLAHLKEMVEKTFIVASLMDGRSCNSGSVTMGGGFKARGEVQLHKL